MAIENYDPRFLDLWQRAATEPVRIPVESKKQAMALRHRLYRFRAELRDHNHPAASLADRCKITLVAEGDKYLLLLTLYDAQFDEALSAANLEPAMPLDPLEALLGPLPKPSAYRPKH